MQVFNSLNQLRKLLLLTLRFVKYIQSKSNRDCGNVDKYLKPLVYIVVILAWLWITLWITCGQNVDKWIS